MNMQITVYSTPTCQQCRLTYRAFDDRHVDYRIVDVTENPEAMAYVTEDLGYTQAPIVVVDDHDHWSGFQPAEIDRIAALQRSTV